MFVPIFAPFMRASASREWPLTHFHFLLVSTTLPPGTISAPTVCDHRPAGVEAAGEAPRPPRDGLPLGVGHPLLYHCRDYEAPHPFPCRCGCSFPCRCCCSFPCHCCCCSPMRSPLAFGVFDIDAPGGPPDYIRSRAFVAVEVPAADQEEAARWIG